MSSNPPGDGATSEHTAPPRRSLMAALREEARGRRRVRVEQLWRAFHSVHPGWLGDPDARAALAATLRDLEVAGHLELPARKGKGWDRAVKPAMPRWVSLPAEAARPSTSDPKAEAWPPELAFVVLEARPRQLPALRAIRSFLAEGGRDREVVPSRERSLELFGDEKRLDALKKTAYFRDGRLSFDLLRCREVAPPLTWEPGPSSSRGRAILVLENLHTWESFRRWNTDRGAYAAVVLGNGHLIQGAYPRLPGLLGRYGSTELLYFGDLDPNGIEIPWATDQRLREEYGVRLRPAARWYRRLLERRLQARALEGNLSERRASAMRWLPSDMRPTVAEMLSAGQWLPQEWVGADTLRREPG